MLATSCQDTSAGLETFLIFCCSRCLCFKIRSGLIEGYVVSAELPHETTLTFGNTRQHLPNLSKPKAALPPGGRLQPPPPPRLVLLPLLASVRLLIFRIVSAGLPYLLWAAAAPTGVITIPVITPAPSCPLNARCCEHQHVAVS